MCRQMEECCLMTRKKKKKKKKCEHTYVNHALGHNYIIDHCIVTPRNIVDVIEANYVINEPSNASSHNIGLLSMTSFIHDILFVNWLVPNNLNVHEPICSTK